MTTRQHHVRCAFERLFVSAAVALGLLLASCGSGGKQGDPPSGGGTPGEGVVPVRVEEVRPTPFTETLQLTGTVRATDDVTVSTEEGGVLRQWMYPRGAWVSKGDLIAQMKDDVLKPMLDAAQAQFQAAELTFERQEKVLKEQGISEVQLKASQYARDAARAQAELARARWERSQVKSPVDGVLEDRFVDEGELVPPGAPVARIVSLGNLKAIVNVPERYVPIITRGTGVQLTTSAYPGEVFNGTVSFVGSAVIPDNRTVPIEVLIRGSRGRLKPDMIVRVVILQNVRRPAILVHEDVLQRLDQNTVVVYLEESGRAVRHVVTLGGRSDSRVEILSGLKEGDRLIVSGQQNVFDGQTVQVQQ